MVRKPKTGDAVEKKPEAAKKFCVEAELKKNYTRLIVMGDVTVKNVTALRKKTKEIMEDGSINLVFDLSSSKYIDSSGLGFFIGTLKKLKESGGEIRITGLNQYISGIFRLVNLSSIIPIYDDPKEACKF